MDEIRHEMATSVDIYLEWCEEKGLEPESAETADRSPMTLRAIFYVLRRGSPFCLKVRRNRAALASIRSWKRIPHRRHELSHS